MLSMESMKYPTVPEEVVAQIRDLGQRIRLARTHRRLRQEDLAMRASMSRTAIEAVERGEITTGIGTYLRVLWALGLNREFDILADPGLDREGMALQFSALDKRVTLQRKLDNDF